MSTGRTGTINQALGIALIVFVMLTFILTVTTYLFFGQKIQAEQQLADQATKATEESNKAEKEVQRFKSLVEFVGLDPEKPVEDLREEFKAAYPDYDEKESGPATIASIAKWLNEARLKKDAQLEVAQAAKAAAEEAQRKAEASLTEAADTFAKNAKAMEAKVQEVEAEAGKRRSDFENEEKKFVDEKQKVLEQVESLKQLVDEIAAGENLVGAKAFDGKDAKTRVGLLLRTIRDRNKAIEVLERSELLRTVASADPKVQLYVLEALGATAAEIESLKPLLRRTAAAAPEAEPVDGRIVAVDQRDRSVTISCESTFGIRPGLVFNVHPGTLPAASKRSVKAVVEVVEVDGGSLVRGRIRRDSITDPILVGDSVSTPLWSPGKPLEAVVVGFVDLDGDGKQDVAALEELVRREGGIVVRSVGASTSVVVDAGKPSVRDDDGESRETLKPADEKRRNLELAEARGRGVRVLPLNTFLDWLGAGRPATEEEAVAVPGPARVPPTRTDLSY